MGLAGWPILLHVAGELRTERIGIVRAYGHHVAMQPLDVRPARPAYLRILTIEDVSALG